MSKIKLCGLTRPEDIRVVNVQKPDYIGFVFAPSRRQVTPGQAAGLKKLLSPAILAVGVFVNAPLEEILSIVQAGIIDLIQLHGDESPDYITQLRKRMGMMTETWTESQTEARTESQTEAPTESQAEARTESQTEARTESQTESQTEASRHGRPLPIIKAVRVQSAGEILSASQSPADYLLFDTYVKGSYGGSGRQFDWSLIPPLSKPYFLAGGLDAGNLLRAMSTGAYCLDLSSAVETDGLKDPVKIEEIMKIIRSVPSCQKENSVSTEGNSSPKR